MEGLGKSAGGCNVIKILYFYLLINICIADHVHMVKEAEPIAIALNYETTLMCIMNIEPDKFQWKFYPSNNPYNPKYLIDLNKSNFTHIPHNKYIVQRRQSGITLVADSPDIAGDYQCLAHYGASVVASVPWQITIATPGQLPKQNNTDIIVIIGNTINWRCELPIESNPEPYIDYYQNGQYVTSFNQYGTKSLILMNVTTNHTGHYSCNANNVVAFRVETLNCYLNLKVVQNGPLQAPFFIIQPKKVYTAIKGDTVFLECSAVGNPIPRSIWEKKNGQLPSNRVSMDSSGLVIKNITQSDEGIYICIHKNNYGSITQYITLIYNEEPSIDCLINATDVKQGENLDLDCIIKGGVPEPNLTWFLNGYNVLNDSSIEAIGNKIYFRPTEKRHAGNLQLFARNIVKTVYSSISIKVIPISTSVDVSTSIQSTLINNSNQRSNNNNNNNYGQSMKNHHRHNKTNLKKLPKHTKMVPPTKPYVSRLNDEAVVVRWSVPANKGLPIQFFKVQYRELGPFIDHNGNGVRNSNNGKGSRWKTTNADIPPHIGSYEVNNLKPDHIYKFRIAAVYSNNDNKLSQNSDKFILRKMDFDKRNPLPVPIITHTDTINSTAVKIYWKYLPQSNITINGFFINYISASSAADYMKATVDGESTNSYILSHLQPDTIYDIKLQSFTLKSASEFSAIMKAKTSPNEIISITTSSTTTTNHKDNNILPLAPTTTTTSSDNGMISKLYIIIAAGVVGSGLVIGIIALLFFCRKWKQKKNRDNNDKPAVDDHHIQVDVVSTSKSGSRANGCLPSNRITITANPLADAADNKNQNMIEMSCLSSQNNNCTSSQPSISDDGRTIDNGDDGDDGGSGDSGGFGGGTITNNHREDTSLKKSRIRTKPDTINMTIKSRENYV